VHKQLLACNQFALESIRNEEYLQYSYTFNKISSKAKVLRQRSTEDNSIENWNVVTTASRRFDTRRKFVFNLGTISLVIQHVITTNMWLYTRTINCVPNKETNELRIARITLCNKVQKTSTQFVIYRTSAWNCRQVITCETYMAVPKFVSDPSFKSSSTPWFITIQIP